MEVITITKKQCATKLLRRYDKMKSELILLEHELNTACADLGRASTPTMWGYTKDMLRNELKREK